MADNLTARTCNRELETLRMMLLSQSTHERSEFSDLETSLPMIQVEDMYQTEGEVALNVMHGSDETTVLEAVNPHPEVAPSNTLNLVEAYTIEGLVEEVKSRPCLWNTSLRVYKEAHRKRIAWDEIAKKFAKDVEFIKTQWKYLKDNLKRCLDRRKKETRSGSAACKMSTCKYFENLIFLQDKIANRETVSNITLDLGPSANSLVTEGQVIVSEETAFTPPLNKRKALDDITNESSYDKRPVSKSRRASDQVDTMLIKALKDLDKPTTEELTRSKDALFA